MLRLHKTASTYGTLPSDVIGYDRGSWEAWIINVCAEQVGDQWRASQIGACKPIPVAVVG